MREAITEESKSNNCYDRKGEMLPNLRSKKVRGGKDGEICAERFALIGEMVPQMVSLKSISLTGIDTAQTMCREREKRAEICG